MLGALLRASASEASGGFGHVGHGGHDGGIGSERRSVRSFSRGPQADVCLASERWPVGSHGCDPGMKRDSIIHFGNVHIQPSRRNNSLEISLFLSRFDGICLHTPEGRMEGT